MNNALIVGELAVSSGTSMAIATGVNAEPLLTALITLGVSLVTLVGGEIVKFLYAFFKKKREELEGVNKDSQSKEAVEDKNKEE